MELFTASNQNAKEVGKGVVIDITVKSGIPMFAPTWDMVMMVKSAEDKKGALKAQELYVAAYKNLMRLSYHNNKESWLEVLTEPVVTITCYCRPGQFCHRHELIPYLQAVAMANELEFTYSGELIPKENPNIY